MNTPKAFRIALTAAALCAAGTSAADAKPRRVVILDFDGPRTLADKGRTAVVNVLGEQYDVVSTQRWEKARTANKSQGPLGWRKAAKQSGVDAVIEGWIQDEGRSKLLYLLVRDASTGDEIEKVSVKLGKAGVTTTNTDQLRVKLDEVLEFIEPINADIASKLEPVSHRQARQLTGQSTDDAEAAEAPPARRSDIKRDTTRKLDGASSAAPDAETDGDVDSDGDGGETVRKPRVKVAAAGTVVEKQVQEDKVGVTSVFGLPYTEGLPPDEKRELAPPWRTPRFEFAAGGYYGSRSFIPLSDSDETQDYSARSKGIALHAAVYPFPTKKLNGQLSGIGFTFDLYQSAGSELVADTETENSTFSINQGGFAGAVHYRQPLGIVSIDGEVGYSQDRYKLPQDLTVDVPDAAYSAFHAGAHLDLHVTDHAEVGFGAKLFYVLDNGDISDIDWYGPGSSSGFNLDASFKVPLPKQLFVRGDLSYRRIATSFDGVGGLTELDGVESAADATMSGSVKVGIAF